MDDFNRPVARLGGTAPTSFPHVCPRYVSGASKENCTDLTNTFQQNKDACCASKCNSELRKCIVCLEMGRRGKAANVVTDTKIDHCDEHKNGAASEQATRQVRLPADPRRKTGVAHMAPASPKPKPVVTPSTTQHVDAELPISPALKPKALDGEVPPPIQGVRFQENSRWRPLIERAQKALAEGIQVDIPPEQIRPMPNQPRKFFGEEGIMRLADSFKIVGQIVRGFVRKVSDGKNGTLYELIDGERRLRAAKLAGLPFKATIIEVDDAALAFIIAAVANFNRADHTSTEISDSIEVMRVADLRMEEIAEMIGISLHWAYQLHSLQKLHPEVRDMLDPSLPKEKQLAVTAAIDISKAEQYLQLGLARRFMEGDVTLRGLRKEVVKASVEHQASIRIRATEPSRKWDSMERHSGVLRRSVKDLKQMLDEEGGKLPEFLSERNTGRLIIFQGSLKSTREMIVECEDLIAKALGKK